MQAAIYLTVAICLAASQPASPAGQTKCTWAQGDGQQTITLYADGRMANAKGETKNYRWWWTEEGLVLNWYSGRFLFKPHGDGGFRGRQTNAKPGRATREIRLRVQGADGAGVLAWAEPLLDGLAPSGIERQADAAARAVVAEAMAKQWAKVAAAGKRLDAAESALAAAMDTAARQADAADGVRGRVSNARSKAQKYERRTHRRIDPAYSWASFSRALADWQTWESRRAAAERDLASARAALERTQDRRARLAAEVRQAWAAYEIASADYAIEFWTRWRPIYQQRKAAYKAEAARVLAEAELRRQPARTSDEPVEMP